MGWNLGSDLGLLAVQIMSLWPFKQMIIKSGAKQQLQSLAPSREALLKPESLFSFGDATEIRRTLRMTNRLTG